MTKQRMSEQPLLADVGRVSIEAFLDRLASSAPTPGGGAAAALIGALSAALVSMVCQLTIGRPRFASVDAAMQRVRLKSEQARQRLLALADEDAVAYAGVAAALRLPRTTEDERLGRAAAIQQALVDAVRPPLEAVRECRSLLPLCLEVAAHGNPTVVSDAGVAAELAAAGVRASVLNARVNLAAIKDDVFVARSEAEIETAEAGLQDDLDRVRGIVRAKLAPKGKP